MANELQITASFSYAKGTYATFTRVLASGLNVTVAGTVVLHNTQIVGATEEALVLGDIGTPGYVFAKNLDATDSIRIRSGTGAAGLIDLKPGEIAVFRCLAAAPFVISSANTPKLEYIILEA